MFSNAHSFSFLSGMYIIAFSCEFLLQSVPKACAAILMASSNHGVELPLEPRPWWQAFVGPSRNQDLFTVCNLILALQDEQDMDVRRSRYAFVESLGKEPSFNDPESYLWSVAD